MASSTDDLIERLKAKLPKKRLARIQARIEAGPLPEPMDASQAGQEVRRRYNIAAQDINVHTFSGPLEPNVPFSEQIGDWVRKSLEQLHLKIAEEVHYPNNDLMLAWLFLEPERANIEEYAEYIQIILNPDDPV